MNDVPVDGDVETEELNEGLVLAETKEGGEVPRVVLVGVDGRELTLAVDVLVDATSNVGKLGNPATRLSDDEAYTVMTLTSPCSPRRLVPSIHAC